MDKTILHIKNMVCPRCIAAVERALEKFDIPYQNIQLGEVVLNKELNKGKRSKLISELKTLGFELLSSKKSILISRIKTLIIEKIHYEEEPFKELFSSYLSRKLFHDYGYLSHLFSSVEGITIEKYVLQMKIERVKELLFYNELTLSEIAHRLNYSSVAHLSAQFKKEIGMTPTEFKKMNRPSHRSLDM